MTVTINGNGVVTGVTSAPGLEVPSGTIAFFGASSAPTGYLKANGAAVSRTTYSSLFAAIGTTYGAGDGSTTFTLPDLRGYFPRGWNDNGSVDSGRAFGSAQSADIGYHYHAFNTGVQGSGSSGNWVSNTPTVGAPLGFSGDLRPVNVALLGCIKY